MSHKQPQTWHVPNFTVFPPHLLLAYFGKWKHHWTCHWLKTWTYSSINPFPPSHWFHLPFSSISPFCHVPALAELNAVTRWNTETTNTLRLAHLHYHSAAGTAFVNTAVSRPTWRNMPASLTQESTHSWSQHLWLPRPDPWQPLQPAGLWLLPHLSLCNSNHTLLAVSLKSHTASCLHILALHPVPSVCNTFLDFSIGNILHTFQYGQMSTHSPEALSDALYFQMFMTNGHTLHLYSLHTLQFLYLYLMIMSFLVFFLAKLRKKFFFERGDLFSYLNP